MNAAREFKKNLIELLPRLQRYALSLTGAAAQADDLLQATCERALSRWTQLKQGTDMDRWLFTIMSSIWKNELRAAAIRTGAGFVDPESLESLGSKHKAEGNIYLAQVLNNIMALPETQRSALVLVYVEGHSYIEAADILEVPVGTVMSRLSRARVILAERLGAKDLIPNKHMERQQ